MRLLKKRGAHKSTFSLLFLCSAAAALLGFSERAHAECLKAEDMDAFVSKISFRMWGSEIASGLNDGKQNLPAVAEHALNRLSFGPVGLQARLQPDEISAQRIPELAGQIATSLRRAGVRRSDLADILVRIEHAGWKLEDASSGYRNPYGPIEFDFDNTKPLNSMQWNWQQALALRHEMERSHPETGPEPDRDAYFAAQSKRNKLMASMRESTQALRLVDALYAADFDLGALIREFWNNHFNVDSTKVAPYALHYQKVVAANVCRTFEDLLIATAKHPAMLFYLDNATSRKGNLNQNYARELLELHTFGDNTQVNFNTDTDLDKVARLFTGWTVSIPASTRELSNLGFRFNETVHDNSEVNDILKVQPITIPPGGGVQRGLTFLRHLAQHPATKRNICKKLIDRFIGYANGHVMNDCLEAWGSKGDLGKVYQAILTSPEMWEHRKIPGLPTERKEAIRNVFMIKGKNPLELMASGIRALGLPVRASELTYPYLKSTISSVAMLGIPIAQVSVPTGYPESLPISTDPTARGTAYTNWISPTYLISWQRALFSQGQRFDLITNGRPAGSASGPAAEASFKKSLADATAAATPGPSRIELIRDVAASLGLRRASFVVNNGLYPVIPGRMWGDIQISSPSNTSLLRPVAHGVLSSADFIRK